MSTQQSLKNYYAILGVLEDASLFEIEKAYEKLANKWHPDKHKEHRKSAELKFQEISEAFEVLSDRNKRVNYDELLNKHYSLTDANMTFQKFFNENEMVGEEEEKFLNQHYPNPLNNSYKILGIPRNATLDEIKGAYRRLALQYHPKNNPGNEQANSKFIEVSQAYNTICNEFKRSNYDSWLFGEIAPVRAHSIFDDFFGKRWSSIDSDFMPHFQNRWDKNLDQMFDEEQVRKGEGQSIKTTSVWSNKNGTETGKTVTNRKTYKQGKIHDETTEDYLYPNGERKVTKTINNDGKVDTKEYRLKKGEQIPMELTN